MANTLKEINHMTNSIVGAAAARPSFSPPMKTPWAVLLTKWGDDNSEPKPQSFFDNLFTATGRGTFNMVDHFWTMSHATVDLNDSTVFGWSDLGRPKADYVGNVLDEKVPKGKFNRGGLVDLAIAAANANLAPRGVDLSKFWGVVVVMNTASPAEDPLFGYQGERKACCSSGSAQPSLLGQEMGHGYGLFHSRKDGSDIDYQDPWDTMSTARAYEAANTAYTAIGPGLNAANMRDMAWLDEKRVWKPSTPGAFEEQIELRPLHRLDLEGLNAAELPGTRGGFLVEFRVSEQWDAGIPASAVFVHRLQDNHSYLMLGISGRSDLRAGDIFRAGSVLPERGATTVRVDEINEDGRYAKITVGYQPPTSVLHTGLAGGLLELVGQVSDGVAVDGGGVVIIGGQPIHVPPRSELSRVMQQIGAYKTADIIADPLARIAAKKSALSVIAKQAQSMLAELTETETPPVRPAGKGKKG
jgi:hypothetical protein